MASFNKFHSFAEYLAEKVVSLGADTLKVMLTNTAPVAGNSIRANLTEIAAGNGYSAGGTIATRVSSELDVVTDAYELILSSVVFTASGGSIGPFRYAVLYDDTTTSPADVLIGWWDYGSSLTLVSGESVTVGFSAAFGVLSIQ